MIKDFIQQIADTHRATLTFETTTDNIWKYEKQVAKITNFKNFFDKLFCENEIVDEFRRANVDVTVRGQFNPDIVIIEWRE